MKSKGCTAKHGQIIGGYTTFNNLCKGCEWEEERKIFLDMESEVNIPRSCKLCSRHYAQLKDNYTSYE